jgi:hypothetical protein
MTEMTAINPTLGDFCRCYYYLQRWRIPKWGIHVIIPVVGAVAYLRWVHATTGSLDVQSFFAPTVTVLILMALWPLQIVYFSYRAHHHAKSEKTIPFQFEATTDGITLQTDLTKSEVKWERFKKIVETDGMLLFWYDRGVAVVIPKTQLLDWARVKDMIKTHYKGKAKFRS